MIGLSAMGRRSVELLVGRDIDLVVGLRVVIASRYSHDVWARDETGGRDGTIVSVLESAPDSHSTALVKGKGAGGGDTHQGIVVVRWDRTDGRDWASKSTVEPLYTGTYRCGSKGHYHLALAASQPLQADGLPMLPSTKREGSMQTGEAPPMHPDAWDWLYKVPEDDAGEVREVAARVGGLEMELMELEAKVLAQMDTVADMCEQNIDSVDTVLPGMLQGPDSYGEPSSGAGGEAADGPDDNPLLLLKPHLMKRAQWSRWVKAFPAVKEEAKLEEESGDIWAAMEHAEKCFRAKVNADQAFQAGLDALQGLTRPCHLIFVAAAVPEIERKLERLLRSGFNDPLSHGAWSNVRQMLIPRPADATPEEAQQAEERLVKVKTDLEGLIRQLNAWKFRHPLLEAAEDEGDEWFKKMTPAEEAALPEAERARRALIRPLTGEEERKLSGVERAARDQAKSEHEVVRSEAKRKVEASRRDRAAQTYPQLMKMMMEEDGAAADVWITALEEVAGQPEAEFIKDEIEQVANTLKGAKDALKKLKEWEEKATDPDSNTPEGSKKRLEEHAEILKEVAESFGGDKDGDKKDKKDAKKKDDKKGKDAKDGGSDKFGPQYDPEDYMGGAEAGNRLQDAVKMARDATMAMRLRQDEVRHRRELDERDQASKQVKAYMFASSSQTDTPSGSYYDGAVVIGGETGGTWEEAQASGLTGARSSLNTAWRLHARVDAAAYREALRGGGPAAEEGMEALVDRVGALRKRLFKLDESLSKVEDGVLGRARQVIAAAEAEMRGHVRGEFLFDAGRGHAWIASARRALDMCVEAQRLRLHDSLLREQANACRRGVLAREQAARLLAESASLVLASETKLADWVPVDALVLYATARDKWARAQIVAPI